MILVSKGQRSRSRGLKISGHGSLEALVPLIAVLLQFNCSTFDVNTRVLSLKLQVIRTMITGIISSCWHLGFLGCQVRDLMMLYQQQQLHISRFLCCLLPVFNLSFFVVFLCLATSFDTTTTRLI